MAEIQNDQKPTIKIHGHEFEVTASEAEDFRRFRRRIRYLEINIKQERFDRERAVLMPSKEDSLDRLYEQGIDFAGDQEPLEDTVITKIMADKLHECLNRLTDNERTLIFALFFQGKTERQISAETNVPQKTINDKKQKILYKLLKMIQN